MTFIRCIDETYRDLLIDCNYTLIKNEYKDGKFYVAIFLNNGKQMTYPKDKIMVTNMMTF